MPASRAEIALSLGVLAAGSAAAAIGPNFMPGLVSAGLIALGAWLLYEALSGGWRQRSEEEKAFQRAPFLWVSAGLFAHLSLIGWAGFVIAGATLFVFVARGFGSRLFLRDLAAGVALALAVYLFFTQVLNVGLPAGWMPFRP